MELSNELVTQFAKITKDEKETQADTVVYGVVVEQDGKKYVNIDGSDILTPMASTTNVGAGERVTILIKNHTATITGNISSPSARGSEVDGVKTELKTMEDKIVAQVTREDVEEIVQSKIEVTDENISLVVQQLENKLDVDAPSVGVISGSSVVINEEQVKITSPETVIAIPSTDGDEMAAQFDENGLTAAKITCPNVAPMYDGPKTLYVDATFSDSYLENGKYEPGDCFRSLKDALAKLSYKFIPYQVSINVGGHYIMIEYGDMALIGCIATHGITISAYNGAYPALLCGQFTIRGSLGFFNIRYINIKPPAAKHGIHAYGNGIYCYVNNCIITGTGLSSDTYGVFASDGAKIYAQNCEFYNCECSLVSMNLGEILSRDNKGNCVPYIENATMHVHGTAPHSESNPSPYWVYIYGAHTLVTNSETVDQGSVTSSTVTTTTATYLATSNYNYESDGSMFDQAEVLQGWHSSTGRIRGCMWFDNTTIRSNLSGRTIRSATLRLSMRSGVGRGVSVTVELSGTVANSGASSAAVTKSYGVIGKTTPGEVTTITIPNDVITDLNNGTINGIMLYSSDTGAHKTGYSYSTNYAKFDGSNASDEKKPMLTIVYS